MTVLSLSSLVSISMEGIVPDIVLCFGFVGADMMVGVWLVLLTTQARIYTSRGGIITGRTQERWPVREVAVFPQR